MLIYLAALESIPSELYEAADVDGASGVRKFFAITLPLIQVGLAAFQQTERTLWEYLMAGTTLATLPMIVLFLLTQRCHTVTADGSHGIWNSLTEVEVWGVGTTATVPADVLDLTNWKMTLPTGSEGSPTEIKQPALDSFSSAPHFVVESDAVQFRAAVNAVTTSGSSYPRSELREMTNNGADHASWSSTQGTHLLVVSEAFTKLPNTKPHVVGAQIHDADDDVTVFRLEGTSLYITNGNNTHHKLVTSNYVLGTRYEAKFVVSGGQVKAYYNGTLQTTISKNFTGGYFKAGGYTQATATTRRRATAATTERSRSTASPSSIDQEGGTR
jgi:Alginate lyase